MDLIYVIITIFIAGLTVFAIFQPFKIGADEGLCNRSAPLFPKSSSSLQGSPTAPSVRLPSTAGRNISLSDYAGQKNVLLYFQEGIMCAPCWQQLEDIQNLNPLTLKF